MSNWRGRSLAFIRQTKGWPPRFPNAVIAYQSCEVNDGAPKQCGDICWFQGGQWGDCGLYLGNGQLLTLHPSTGLPIVCLLKSYADKQVYLGWSPGNLGTWPLAYKGPAKAEASSDAM